MKKLNKFFGLMLITGSMAFISTAKADETKCGDSPLYVTFENGDYSCQSNLKNALNAVKEKNTTGSIVLLKDVTPTAAQEITVDTIIDLNNHKLTSPSAASITVKGATLTIKNGTLEAGSSSNNVFTIDSKEKESTLTIEDTVTVEGETLTGGAFVKVSDATKETVVNINGNWTVKNEIVDCDNGKDKDLTVNFNANVEAELSSNSLVSLDAGSSVVNVLGGNYTTDKLAFGLKNGVLNISGGVIKTTKANAIKVEAPDGENTNTLNITGGEIVSTHSGSYSLFFAGSTNDKGAYSISGGTFTSGKDAEGNQLPAINISSKTFLTNYPGIITGGTFTGAIVGDTAVESGTRPAANAIANLVGNAVVTEENGVVTVGNKSDDPEPDPEPEPIPEPEPNPSTGDPNTDENEENPQTGDNVVGSIAMGLTGLMGIVGSAFVFDKKNKLQ